MATSSGFLSEDQLRCSICLDTFIEPVSTPCGHTFCKDCLTRHWMGKTECQCPLCNNKFSKDLRLSVNTAFRDVVDKYKKLQATADATSSAKPGEVSCDLCPAKKIRASKTCMVCLASFCEKHLEPHLKVAALQRHQLSNPVPNLEERICREHNRMLEFFCLNDHIRFCALCTEHSGHGIVSLNDTYTDQRSHIWRRKENENKTKHKNNKTAKGKKKGKGERSEIVNAQQTTPPHPFNGCNCMFSNPGNIGGKAFLELHVNGMNECDLAAVGKSAFGTSTFPPRWDGSSIVRFRVSRNTSRILVVVDYDDGLVVILDPDNDILIHKLTGSRFKEEVLLIFVPSQFELLNWFQSLQRPIQRTAGQLDSFYLWLGLCMTAILFYCLVGF